MKVGNKELCNEEIEMLSERYTMAMERIAFFLKEQTEVPEPYRDYFVRTAEFIQEMDAWKKDVEDKVWQEKSFDELKSLNRSLYRDILTEEGAYEKSYANPSYAVKMLGQEMGQLLCFLYTEIRGDIIYAAEQRFSDMTIHAELFVQILCMFEDEIPSVKEVRDTLYYFVSD